MEPTGPAVVKDPVNQVDMLLFVVILAFFFRLIFFPLGLILLIIG